MIDASQPTTLHGIKALAKGIKKAEGLQHVRALDKAAIRAGYQNFNHARNRLAGFKPTQTTPTPEAAVTAVFPVWVTVA